LVWSDFLFFIQQPWWKINYLHSTEGWWPSDRSRAGAETAQNMVQFCISLCYL